MSNKEGKQVATAIFRVMNPELFIRPRKWVGLTGTLLAVSLGGYLYYHGYKMDNDRAYRNRYREAVNPGITEEAEIAEEKRRLAAIAARNPNAAAALKTAKATADAAAADAAAADATAAEAAGTA